MRQLKFHCITTYENGSFSCNVSAAMLARHIKKTLKVPIGFIYRVDNDQPGNTYDHLVFTSLWINEMSLMMICDQGGEAVPMFIMYASDLEVNRTEIYDKEIANMKHHASEVEDKKSKPILILSDEEAKDLLTNILIKAYNDYKSAFPDKFTGDNPCIKLGNPILLKQTEGEGEASPVTGEEHSIGDSEVQQN